ncbi:MAG TPA: hypothetical protein VMU82_00175 [Acetobacteraceae bacterium]|nr:hypothetical protein [Acetobacteraceae bacterium]
MEQEKQPERKAGKPANDNGADTGKPIDPRILRIAQAIGRQLAREQAGGRLRHAANDNTPQGSCPNARK